MVSPYYHKGQIRGKEFALLNPNSSIEEILENEENARQSQDFTPFAYWLNNAPDSSKAWVLYEAGLVAGIDSILFPK